MSSTKKHRDFVSTPIGDNNASTLPGIPDSYQTLFSELGFDKAYIILGKFLLLKKEKNPIYSLVP
jgi:barrier-to-autointegration factor